VRRRGDGLEKEWEWEKNRLRSGSCKKEFPTLEEFVSSFYLPPENLKKSSEERGLSRR
jgi:hypothetical protein